MGSNTEQNGALAKMLQRDKFTVELLPQKKGYLKRHVEYSVQSERFKSQVVRRYNDFHALHEVLLWRYPYRIIPQLPPQKITALVAGVDSEFAEIRRKGLARWLKIISAHPIISQDPSLEYFLTRMGDDLASNLRDHFKSVPDEFVAGLSTITEESDYISVYKSFGQAMEQVNLGKEQVDILSSTLTKVLGIVGKTVTFAGAKKDDMMEFSRELKTMGSESFQIKSSHIYGESTDHWGLQKDTFRNIAQEVGNMGQHWQFYSELNALMVEEPLKTLQAVLLGYRDLMERGQTEKSLAFDLKKNGEKIRNLQMSKFGGVLSASPLWLKSIQDRLEQSEIDLNDLNARRAFAISNIAEETRLVFLFTELLGDAVCGLCSAEIKGLQDITDGWSKIQPKVAKLKVE